MAIWAGGWGRLPIDDKPFISSLICSLEAKVTATLLIISLEKCLEKVHGKSYVTLGEAMQSSRNNSTPEVSNYIILLFFTK